jgi:hypothetical protein
MTFFPTVANGAWATVRRSPGSANAAVGAMLGVLGRGRESATMFRFMASNTESQAVGNVKGKFGMFRQRQNVMGVEVAAFLAACLACIAVAFKNRLTPFCKVAHVLTSCTVSGAAALPRRSLFSDQRLATTRARAESSVTIFANERFFAILALARNWRIADRPARLRAVVSSIDAIRFNFELGAALPACLGYLRVLHMTIIPLSTHIREDYVAVALERWATATGKTPVLIPNGAT